MKIAIIGDSFTISHKGTWLETLCNSMELTLISQQGYGGQSEFKIYRNFKEVISVSPDVILCCHTHHARLYHPNEPISFSGEGIKNQNVIRASQEYYIHLYDDNFAREIQNLLVKDIQNICKQKNIKLINVPCFEHDHIEKFYGLWITSGQGLMSCSKADYQKTYNTEWVTHIDRRLNHFSPDGHKILANNIIPHIKKYITTTQEFHISLLYPELFA